MTSSILFEISKADVVRPSGEFAFRDLNWTVRGGETWAIVGPTGSGKSSLTDVLFGRLRTVSGVVEWPIVDRLRDSGRTINWPSEIITRVAFKEESRLFSYSKHYYQQRFNFIEAEDDLTLEQFLRAGTSAPDDRLEQITHRLGIDQLMSLSFIKLSNGQTRRARIAKALLEHPEILVLDEPFVGLDVDGRRELDSILEQLVADGTRLVLIVPADAIPGCVSHVLQLDACRVTYLGPRARYSTPKQTTVASTMKDTVEREPIVELQNVCVTYSGIAILDDLTWTVRAGERWAILGPNGSGKSTLLALLCGDHPQAYGNHVKLFGVQRGDGDSIWDIKRRVGFFSPELHLYFSEPLSAERAAATGFFDVLVSRPTTPEQDERVRELFEHFGIAELRLKPFAQLSTGQQRIVLLIRALVKTAPFVILDEPFQTLDSKTKELARSWIDERISGNSAVLFVTHDESELPRTICRRLRLREGRIVEFK